MKIAVLYDILPELYCEQFRLLSHDGLKEIRMRIGQPMLLDYGHEERRLWPCVEKNHLEELLQRACRYSPYTCADSLRQGYVSIEGGHRIGICGTGFVKDGELQSLRNPTSISVRIASQVHGFAEELHKQIAGSTLILGPPGRGKTTLLRDLIVHLSEERTARVGVVDERGEIAACVEGVPQLWVGGRTDVLTNVRKDKGIMMLLRTMNPEWIAVDEITAAQDVNAMEHASYCGVKIIATAHADGVSDLKKRPVYRHLLETGVFSQAAVILPDRTYRVEKLIL